MSGIGRISTSSDTAALERLFKEFFRIPEIGLALYDKRFRYEALNPSLARINGAPPECHLGKSIHEILGHVGSTLEPIFTTVLNSGKPVLNFEFSGVLPMRKPGLGHWSQSVFPVADASGNVTQLASVIIELPQNTGLANPRQCGNHVLRSWKEIADYTGTCVKTVQRWEQTDRLPIRRVRPGKGSTVFALRTEIDCWIQTRTFKR